MHAHNAHTLVACWWLISFKRYVNVTVHCIWCTLKFMYTCMQCTSIPPLYPYYDNNEKVMNIISKCNTHSDTLAVNSDMHVVCSCATAFDNVCMHMDVACHIHINKMRVSGHCGTHPISKSHTTFNL